MANLNKPRRTLPGCVKNIVPALIALAVLLTSYTQNSAFAAPAANYFASSETSNTQDRIGGLTESQLGQSFGGYQASFVLRDLKDDRIVHFNPKMCGTRLSPCSSFKIFNALVGLETGVLTSENHSMKWDGTKYDIAGWNRDQTLQSAITNSVVWYFQKTASAVGENRMKKFIHKTHYGNEDISGGITRFWLGNTLKISADEQVDFIEQLVKDELPFSKRSMAIVRGLLRLTQTDKGTLYGKTGTDSENGKNILGWFVGYLVQPDHTYVFAANIKGMDDAKGKKAREIVETVFKESGLL